MIPYGIMPTDGGWQWTTYQPREAGTSGPATLLVPWVKPVCNWVFILAAGGAGGGGGGCSGAAGSPRGGASGGGAGGMSFILMPSTFFPDYLFFRIGGGSAGGPPNGVGSPGNSTFINMRPDAVSNGNLMSAGGGGAGNRGLTTAGGAFVASGGGSTGSFLATIGGIARAYQAPNSAGGGAHTGAGGGTHYPEAPINSGSGGGGVTASDQYGGACSYNPNLGMPIPDIVGGDPFTTPDAIHGRNGLHYGTVPKMGVQHRFSVTALIGSGGTGGAAKNTSEGGNGGNGGPACGGGGGGGGTTGGAGGRGGDGFVIVGTI